MATKKKTAKARPRKKVAKKKATKKKRKKKTRMKSGRRPKADTIAGQVLAVQEAADLEPLDPPAHVRLREGDRPFWDEIIAARARPTWTLADLTKAAALARAMADIERLQAQVDVEGDTVETAHGGVMLNPLHQLIETLVKRSVSLARALHVHASGTQGRSRDTGDKTKREKAARRTVEGVGDDDLIAPPMGTGQLH